MLVCDLLIHWKKGLTGLAVQQGDISRSAETTPIDGYVGVHRHVFSCRDWRDALSVNRDQSATCCLRGVAVTTSVTTCDRAVLSYIMTPT
jgi:hypothetical protein